MKRRKVWVSSPVYLALSVAMLIAALYSLQFDLTLFSVNLSLCVISVGGGCHLRNPVPQPCQFRHEGRQKCDYRRRVRCAGEFFHAGDRGGGRRRPGCGPTARFLKCVSGRRDVWGDNVMRFLYPKTLRQVCEDNGTSVRCGDREFTVYAVKTKHGYVLYFVDDTYYKAINREFNDRRPCVCILAFDNREELSHDQYGY